MRRQLLVGLVGWFGVWAAARAQEPALTTVLVTDGVTAPLYVTHAPGDNDRLFVVDQCGQVRIVKCGRLLERPFLDVESLVTCGGERGLLGMAFHPDYADNGQFFIDYTNHDGDTVIARYHVSNDPDAADPTGETVLSIHQPYSNHNGGWIDFGPDGYLYIAMGDGGGAYDDAGTSQDNTDLLASLLRIDVDGDDFPEDPGRNYAIPPDNPFVDTDGADEVWAYGLRNPWRCAFDQLTGELTSATSARVPSRKSTCSRRTIRAAPTTAGSVKRASASPAMPMNIATLLRWSIRCMDTTIAGAAPSRAVRCTGAVPYPNCKARIFSRTSAARASRPFVTWMGK